MRVGAVISTIGRPHLLGPLLESLEAQSHPAQQIIVVDQSEGPEVAEVVREWEGRLPVTRLTSGRGLSLGRNTGWKALEECDVVVFPDDDLTFGPEMLAALVAEFRDPQIMAVSGRLVGTQTERVAFDGGRCELDRRTVWTRAIEGATSYRMSALRATGGFDETLGVGCPTIWQSGEGTDLLLRVLASGGRAVFEPSVVVTEHQDEITNTQYLRKVRAYGRGTGRVYRLRYGLFDRCLVVAKPMAATVLYALRGQREAAAHKWQACLGRLEGMLPRTTP